MDHVVYLDAKAKEFEKFQSGRKTMIIRAATGRKLPYGRVHENDVLYFINNNAEGFIKSKAIVSSVFNSEKMDKDASVKLIKDNQKKLQLSDKQYKKTAGKRYIVLIEIKDFREIPSFSIDRSDYGNMDNWLPVEDINKVK